MEEEWGVEIIRPNAGVLEEIMVNLRNQSRLVKIQIAMEKVDSLVIIVSVEQRKISTRRWLISRLLRLRHIKDCPTTVVITIAFSIPLFKHCGI